MIHLKAYDVEILPNFFSIVIVDINHYCQVFKDACVIDKKGKRVPVPLTQIYSVKEIKEKLNEVNTHKFYITDTDDSQLLQMIACINNLRYFDNNNVLHQTHMYGYNSMSYDKLMVAGLLAYFGTMNTTKELITKLYELSKKIIELQDNKEMAKNDYLLKSLRQFGLPYKDVDVMRIFALNKVGTMVKENGEKVYYGKSLKQTSINLQWYELLEHELPPIGDLDRDIYFKNPKYRGLTDEELNCLIDKWDRYIIDDWIEPTMHYNANDVFIVCEMVRLYLDEIKLRYQITNSYEVDVMNSSRSNIADKLFEKFYSEFSGLKPFQWKGKKTIRTVMSFNKVILPFIEFKTPQLQFLLSEMKHTSITSLGKDSFKREVKLGNLVYTVATGGLHSQDIPRELKSKIVPMASSSTGGGIWDSITDNSYIYIHFDIASFYPSLIVNFNVAPKHMNEGCFVRLVKWLRDTRVSAKHSVEEYIDGIPKGVLAEVLKIVINSLYGKLGDENSEICDRLAVLKVTINGQLLIMMLCEELELNGIEVVSANTDGIVVKLYKRDKVKFDEITEHWKEVTSFEADSEEYNCYVNRDINNYLIQETNGKISYKGDLNPKMYSLDLKKGYDMPVVAQAVVNYFIDGKPIMESLYECKNILDFCKTQNVGKQFNVEIATLKGYEQYQRNVRFYVSMNGSSIYKTHKIAKTRSELCAGYRVEILNTLDDKRIELRQINYQYYYEQCMKIIDPIKLNISPSLKADALHKTKSGKSLIKKRSGQYLTLFDDEND